MYARRALDHKGHDPYTKVSWYESKLIKYGRCNGDINATNNTLGVIHVHEEICGLAYVFAFLFPDPECQQPCRYQNMLDAIKKVKIFLHTVLFIDTRQIVEILHNDRRRRTYSPVTGEFFTQRPVTRSFDGFFDLRLNKRLSKQSWSWWFETLLHPLWRHCNINWFPTLTLKRHRKVKSFLMEGKDQFILHSQYHGSLPLALIDGSTG